jgi:3-deoxy-D-manno-octulosonate 8-phosphate phosphatase (KDO 8-P phosphatase)
LPRDWKPKTFVLDVDGVMTTGQFLVSREGKAYKVFGPDDHDALLLLKPRLEVRFVTGDKKGLEITTRRIVDEMKFPLDVVSTVQRAKWFHENLDPAACVYMGDGIFDSYVFPHVGYSIAPANAYPTTRARADYVCKTGGGERAVAEACLHLLERFFEPFDPDQPPSQLADTGEWKA